LTKYSERNTQPRRFRVGPLLAQYSLPPALNSDFCSFYSQ